MPRRKRTIKRIIPFGQMPAMDMKGFAFRLSLKGGELKSGTIGSITPRGRGVTVVDQNGKKLCGFCKQTVLIAQSRADLVIAMNNGQELVISNVFSKRRS